MTNNLPELDVELVQCDDITTTLLLTAFCGRSVITTFVMISLDLVNLTNARDGKYIH